MAAKLVKTKTPGVYKRGGGRKFWTRLTIGYYGAIVAFAVGCFVFGLTPTIPYWLVTVVICAPIVLVLWRG
jgi:hypothetical protein